MAYLILVRHGRSEWNEKGVWTGMTDVPMTEKGRNEVAGTAQVLKELALTIDDAYTSPLIRAKETLDIILSTLEQHPIIHEAPEITERDYGIYTSKNKWKVKKDVGEEEFQKIRRGWNHPIPDGESLQIVYERVIPFYKESIMPTLKKGKNVLISAHGNSLRALVKYLENISDADIAALEIHTGEAWTYTIDEKGVVTSKEIHGKNPDHV